MAEEQKKPPDLASLWGSQPAQESLKKSEGEAAQGEIITKIPLPPEPADEPQEKAPPEPKSKVGVKMPHAGEGETAPELIEAEVIEEEKGLGEKIDELLSELNLSRKHIYFSVGGLVLLVFGIIFGVKFVGNFLEKREGKKEEKVAMVGEQPKAPKVKEKLDSSIRASFAFSKAVLFPPYFYPQGGVELATMLGQPILEKKDAIRVSLFLLKRMQNAFSTDVNGLLQKAINRRGVLENHITLLRHLVDEASTTLAQLDTELSRLKPVFEEALKNQEVIEKKFFEGIERLDVGAGKELEQFIEEAKRMQDSRAHLRAIQIIHQRLARAIPRMQARIQDIELNKEALISGVKIYDVRGSDLELIIPAEGLEGTEPSQPGASKLLGPSRYASPFELPAKDFIKTPGGGM